MARPIEPTPILQGEDMFDFVKTMEEATKVSEEEKKKILEDAKYMLSLMDFTF